MQFELNTRVTDLAFHEKGSCENGSANPYARDYIRRVCDGARRLRCCHAGFHSRSFQSRIPGLGSRSRIRALRRLGFLGKDRNGKTGVRTSLCLCGSPTNPSGYRSPPLCAIHHSFASHARLLATCLERVGLSPLRTPTGWPRSCCRTSRTSGTTQGYRRLWGYGLLVDRPGNFIKKPMSECTGARS